MMNKVFKILGIGTLALLASCTNNNSSSSSSSSISLSSSISTPTSSTLSSSTTSSSIDDNTKIKDEDKVVPTSTKMDYVDHANFGASEYDESKWFKNTLDKVAFPDPQVIEVGDTYYIYGTTDRTGSKTLDCYSTKDFNNFELHMDIYKPQNEWSEGVLFAPEVYEIDGTFYLFYSDNMKSNGLRYINVLTSNSPVGPFEEYKGTDYYGNELDGYKAPIFRHNDSLGLSVLDQNLFIDDDGSMYMYYSIYDTGIMQYIIGVSMLDPVTPDWDTYKILVRPGELTPKTTSTNMLIWEAYQGFKVAEGPFMVKSPVNGKYYLTYSVNHYPDRYYTVCYAYSDEPLGDFTKPYKKGEQWTNLLFGYAGGMKSTTVYDKWEGFMSGTAHHCIFKIGDQYMIGYHAHKNRKDSSNGRFFGLDRLFFNEEGTPYCYGPTDSIEPLPEKISGYKNIVLDAANVKTENITNPEYLTDNFVPEHYNLPVESSREATLGSGLSYVEIDFDKEYLIGGLSIYNSCFYEKALSQIEFIKFDNDNNIIDTVFPSEYLNDEKEFIFPGSAFTYDIKDIKAKRVIIGFNCGSETNLSEISIYGKTA